MSDRPVCAICEERERYILHTPIPESGCNMDLCDCRHDGPHHHPFTPVPPSPEEPTLDSPDFVPGRTPAPPQRSGSRLPERLWIAFDEDGIPIGTFKKDPKLPPVCRTTVYVPARLLEEANERNRRFREIHSDCQRYVVAQERERCARIAEEGSIYSVAAKIREGKP